MNELNELEELDFDPSALKATLLPINLYLEDEEIEEVKIAPYKKDVGAVWYFKHGEWVEATNNGKAVLIHNNKIEQIISFMAGTNKQFAHEDAQIVNCVVPKVGFRFTGVLAPVAYGCSKFNIRKFKVGFYTFEDYAKQGLFAPEYVDVFYKWIENQGSMRRYEQFSVCVFGQTKSGKTTFLNSYVNEKRKKYPSSNWGILEDTKELIITPGNVDRLVTSRNVDLNDLLITSLRLSYDNVVIGEVRGGEAAYVQESSLINNTMFTMHAKDFESAISRFERMMLKNEFVDKVNRKDLCNINGWISLQNVPKIYEDSNGNVIRKYRRQVTEIVELTDYDERAGRYQVTRLL